MHGTRIKVYDEPGLNATLDARLTPSGRAALGLKNITSVDRRDVPGLNELGLDGVKQFPIADAGIVYRTPAQRWDVGIWAPWFWGHPAEWLFCATTFEPTRQYAVRGLSCSVPGYTTLWTVGRCHREDPQGADDELLMLRGTPLLFTNADAAQTVAQLVHPQPVDKKSGLAWKSF